MQRSSARALQVLGVVLLLVAAAAGVVWLRMPASATCVGSLGTTATFVLVIGAVVFGIASLGVWWGSRSANVRVRPWIAGVLGGLFAMDLFGALFVFAAATSPNSCA